MFALASTSVSAVTIEFGIQACEAVPFYDVDVSITCDGSDVSTSSGYSFGSTAIFQGTVETLHNFTDTEIIFKACLWSYCPAENTRSAGMLCGDGWLIPIENQTCGEIGLYNITGEENIPNADITDKYNWLVTAKIGVEEECEQGKGSYTSEESTEYHMSYSMMGAIAGVIMDSGLIVCKSCDGDDDYDDDQSFTAMTDADTVC